MEARKGARASIDAKFFVRISFLNCSAKEEEYLVADLVDARHQTDERLCVLCGSTSLASALSLYM